jgi:hypothetical protein
MKRTRLNIRPIKPIVSNEHPVFGAPAKNQLLPNEGWCYFWQILPIRLVTANQDCFPIIHLAISGSFRVMIADECSSPLRDNHTNLFLIVLS